MAADDDLEGGQPKNFLRPCLLLLLLEGPAHGYDLLEKLRAFGFNRGDPGGVYRSLRSLEHEGLVRSSWETSTAGPARRIYTLTREGEDQLHVWALAIEEARGALVEFIERYAAVTDRPANRGRPQRS